ncbi:MAG: hypothetical protein JWM59_1045 [Verrucomicrobiales bacterium]|nr:hypothetical protein [Verrucomicrobiales bacterium]
MRIPAGAYGGQVEWVTEDRKIAVTFRFPWMTACSLLARSG